MRTWNYEKMHFDMRSKLKTEYKTLDAFEKETGLSRMAFRNISEGLDIRSKTLFGVLEWLGKDLNEYFN